MDWYDRLVDSLEPELRHATDALLDAVKAGPGTRLLDLACGAGHTTAAAKERGADALGIDLAPDMIAVARRRFPQARFAIGDMLDPPAGPWDAITCRFGAHHADPAWLKAACRALVPGGRVAIAEFPPTDAASVKNGMQPASSWVHALEDAGLADVTVTTRHLRLGSLAARGPMRQVGREWSTFVAMSANDHGSPFHDGPVSIITGRKPATPG